jgi:hypothetical protein
VICFSSSFEFCAHKILSPRAFYACMCTYDSSPNTIRTRYGHGLCLRPGIPNNAVANNKAATRSRHFPWPIMMVSHNKENNQAGRIVRASGVRVLCFFVLGRHSVVTNASM